MGVGKKTGEEISKELTETWKRVENLRKSPKINQNKSDEMEQQDLIEMSSFFGWS